MTDEEFTMWLKAAARKACATMAAHDSIRTQLSEIEITPEMRAAIHSLARSVAMASMEATPPDPRDLACAALQLRLETAYRNRLRPVTPAVPSMHGKPCIPMKHAVTFHVVPDYAGSGLVVRGCPPDLFDRLPQRWSVDETSPRYDVHYLEQA